MPELGDRIKYLREKKKMTQKEFIAKAQLTIVQISRYENNERKPDPEALRRIADVLDTNSDYLLGRTDDPSSISKSKSGGRAYLGGGQDWTDEEREIAASVIEAHRKRKKELKEKEDQANKQ